MIKRLKIKFICLAMTSLFILLAAVVAGMNVINFHSVVTEADETLMFLSQNKGMFPQLEDGKEEGRGGMPPHMSPETPYESRYFSVVMDKSGTVIQTDTSKIISVDADTAKKYAETVMGSSDESGFAERFRYVRSVEESEIRITFLDCGRTLDSFYSFLWVSIGMALLGFAVIFVVIVFFADRMIRPVAESYEKQKRFITDAGHEIKTPLTIINANVDILEMDMGDNECLHDIRQQTERLTLLTNELVYLTRMEEAQDNLQKIELPVSDIVYETVISFKALAQIQEKELVYNIQPMLSMEGDQKAIQQLISILMDNALKYSPQGSRIEVNLVKQGRTCRLDVSNITEDPMDKEEITRVFDRFYRADRSRNSETGGHGIGLSAAKAIVTAHGGKIQAWMQDETVFHITVTFSTDLFDKSAGRAKK